MTQPSPILQAYNGRFPDADQLNVASNRTISLHAKCDSWYVIKGGDGVSATITVQYDDGNNEDWGLPSVNGPDQTMYLNNPAIQSGDTRGQVDMFEASKTDPWAYSCNITIDPVVSAVVKEHEVGVNVTRYAAPAIALQGYGTSLFEHSLVFGVLSKIVQESCRLTICVVHTCRWNGYIVFLYPALIVCLLSV
ncbi:N-terminal binuclear Zn cluster-containing protein [Purpureocillium lavendulum]|uniref:N-terminal binuclear Zn cluster-containing protein n=1 Tax=Purpureocillium lavendulum TaxID=1247861 RepID=A0AB34FAJ6_9HYPO|nr:N-terminal binuclear Zn cluster-containing protein [Purpureocillium lavendulum]